MRVALVHYWLVTMRGGEKVLESLCRLYPQADIYTHVLDPAAISPLLARHRIHTSFIQKLPFSRSLYQRYVPLMPLALEQFDLRGYDLVISSESGPAKGVLCRADTPQLCYCHTPMRYLWDFYGDYLNNAGWFTRLFMRPAFHYMRLWDAASANRVDHIVANSHTVARRVRRWWQREAAVVHPPVLVDAYAGSDQPRDEAPYLCLGQLTRYKRVDIAVVACSRLNRRLIVAGDGEEREKLERMAGPGIEFVGRVSDSEAKALYGRCRALLFPGEEDFGMTPVEAQAAGCPVIAYGRGGALETVKDGVSGLFFAQQTSASLGEALERFEAGPAFDPHTLAGHAAHFAEARFHREILAEVAVAVARAQGQAVA